MNKKERAKLDLLNEMVAKGTITDTQRDTHLDSMTGSNGSKICSINGANPQIAQFDEQTNPDGWKAAKLDNGNYQFSHKLYKKGRSEGYAVVDMATAFAEFQIKGNPKIQQSSRKDSDGKIVTTRKDGTAFPKYADVGNNTHISENLAVWGNQLGLY
jgi:hypothetical protein